MYVYIIFKLKLTIRPNVSLKYFICKYSVSKPAKGHISEVKEVSKPGILEALMP